MEFVPTPSSSNVDVFIEKFRLEIGNEEKNEDADTRKLTIDSTVKPQESDATIHDIDQQINDLEDLIKKLQNEIDEMSKNANKKVEYTPDADFDSIKNSSLGGSKKSSHDTIILDKEDENPEILRNEMRKQNAPFDKFESEEYKNVFPLMVRDYILTTSFSKLESQPDKKIFNIGAIPERDLSVRDDLPSAWRELPDFATEDDLDDLLCELQAGITEKMGTLKDKIMEESCNNLDKSDKA